MQNRQEQMYKRLCVVILVVAIFFGLLAYFRDSLSNIGLLLAVFFGAILGILIQFYVKDE